MLLSFPDMCKTKIKQWGSPKAKECNWKQLLVIAMYKKWKRRGFM